MLYKPITVSVEALVRVMRIHGLGEPHVTLLGEAVWSDPQTDEAEDRAAFREFAEVSGSPRLSVDLLDSLTVLARPTVEYYGWFTQERRTTAVLAAAIAGDAVLAVRRDLRIRLAPIDSTRLAETVIGCLPALLPARGPSVNLPRARARAAIAQGLCGDGVVVRTTPSPGWPDAAFARLTVLPSLGGGEFYAALRDLVTCRRMAAQHPVSYHDTVEGRWWMQLVPSHDDDWLVAAPATPELLIARLHEAHDRLTR